MALLDASGPGLPLEQLLGLLGDGRRDLRCPCHCFSSLSKINLDPHEALVKPAIPAPSGAHRAPRRAPADSRTPATGGRTPPDLTCTSCTEPRTGPLPPAPVIAQAGCMRGLKLIVRPKRPPSDTRTRDRFRSPRPCAPFPREQASIVVRHCATTNTSLTGSTRLSAPLTIAR